MKKPISRVASLHIHDCCVLQGPQGQRQGSIASERSAACPYSLNAKGNPGEWNAGNACHGGVWLTTLFFPSSIYFWRWGAEREGAQPWLGFNCRIFLFFFWWVECNSSFQAIQWFYYTLLKSSREIWLFTAKESVQFLSSITRVYHHLLQSQSVF